MDTSNVISVSDSSFRLQPSSLPVLPLPAVDVAVRVGVLSDVPFIDALQKRHTKQVGWMPTKQLEGKIAAGHVLVAWASRPCSSMERKDMGETPMLREEPVGYLIGNDQYFKRDDVGIIYQMNVLPGRQRGLVGATLLKAQFERSAYGCRLYCCWCAQDIEANRFWEAMGFVPLAFRTGGKVRMKGEGGRMKKNASAADAASLGSSGSSFIPHPSSLSSASSARVHIFWQKRIRSDDVTTPWWFPSQTSGGSIREDRIVLPIPPGTHWSDAKPMVLPGVNHKDEGGRLKDERKRKKLSGPTSSIIPQPSSLHAGSGLRFAPVKPPAMGSPMEKPARERKAKQKNDPRLVAAARELRDRWLEQVNADGTALPEARVKYEVCRSMGGCDVAFIKSNSRS